MRGSRIFCQGGSMPDCQKTALTTFFFFSPQLIFQFYRGCLINVYFKENYNFPRFQRGSNIFQGGAGGGGGGGVQMLISIETHITCDFPGGVRTLYSPLWICTCKVTLSVFVHVHYKNPFYETHFQKIIFYYQHCFKCTKFTTTH